MPSRALASAGIARLRQRDSLPLRLRRLRRGCRCGWREGRGIGGGNRLVELHAGSGFALALLHERVRPAAGRLESGRSEEVVSLFEKLVARNGEIEQRLAQLLSRGHKSEGVSTAQLKLLAEMLSTEATAAPEEITDANKKLRETSGIRSNRTRWQ